MAVSPRTAACSACDLRVLPNGSPPGWATELILGPMSSDSSFPGNSDVCASKEPPVGLPPFPVQMGNWGPKLKVTWCQQALVGWDSFGGKPIMLFPWSSAGCHPPSRSSGASPGTSVCLSDRTYRSPRLHPYSEELSVLPPGTSLGNGTQSCLLSHSQLVCFWDPRRDWWLTADPQGHISVATVVGSRVSRWSSQNPWNQWAFTVSSRKKILLPFSWRLVSTGSRVWVAEGFQLPHRPWESGAWKWRERNWVLRTWGELPWAPALCCLLQWC